jgi:hypothetical protein
MPSPLGHLTIALAHEYPTGHTASRMGQAFECLGDMLTTRTHMDVFSSREWKNTGKTTEEYPHQEISSSKAVSGPLGSAGRNKSFT